MRQEVQELRTKREIERRFDKVAEAVGPEVVGMPELFIMMSPQSILDTLRMSGRSSWGPVHDFVFSPGLSSGVRQRNEARIIGTYDKNTTMQSRDTEHEQNREYESVERTDPDLPCIRPPASRWRWWDRRSGQFGSRVVAWSWVEKWCL